MLKIENLSYKVDNRTILNKINLEVPKNNIFAVIGPNGAGKSTLSSVIMGLIEGNIEGNIYFEDKLINDLEVFQRARLGMTMAPQQVADFEGITIQEYLDLSKKYASLPLNSLQYVLMYLSGSPHSVLAIAGQGLVIT
ncbi:MAG TPA: ATP-binding cassette domain-containing protein, partial [Aquificae bacterium]|nr:ATP-binding cassette domain-containing protein [Aquificota bacterium]